jgi:hypothetical protein
MSQILSEVFYAMLVSTLAGLIIAVGKMCYKSKCSSIDICCLKITRNIEAEVKEDLEAPKSNESKKESNL